MIFGIPVEIRQHENRVGAAPFLVNALTERGHHVFVETRAGEGSQYSDADYENSGATIVPSPEKLYGQADIILKVQAPRPVEYDLIRPEHILCGYFFLQHNSELGKALMGRGCTCVSYDLLRQRNGSRPLMELEGYIVGQLAVQQGAHYMRTHKGGRGILLGAVPAVPVARVVVLGASSAGISAADYAASLGASVYLLDADYEALRKARDSFADNINTLISHEQNFRKIFPSTDLLINAIEEYDREAPVLVSAESVALLPKGSVVVDLDIQLGRTIATSKPTTHEHPALNLDGIIHYCVSNLAGVVPVTGSEALSSALLPYLKRLSRAGSIAAVRLDPEFNSGLAIYEGHVANPVLAEEVGVPQYQFQPDDA